MQARAALFQDRFGQEGQQDAMLERHFARHLAEQDHLVDGLDRRVEGQGEFVLRGVIFGGDEFEAEARLFGPLPDRIGETGAGR